MPLIPHGVASVFVLLSVHRHRVVSLVKHLLEIFGRAGFYKGNISRLQYKIPVRAHHLYSRQHLNIDVVEPRQPILIIQIGDCTDPPVSLRPVRAKHKGRIISRLFPQDNNSPAVSFKIFAGRLIERFHTPGAGRLMHQSLEIIHSDLLPIRESLQIPVKIFPVHHFIEGIHIRPVEGVIADAVVRVHSTHRRLDHLARERSRNLLRLPVVGKIFLIVIPVHHRAVAHLIGPVFHTQIPEETAVAGHYAVDYRSFFSVFLFEILLRSALHIFIVCFFLPAAV